MILQCLLPFLVLPALAYTPNAPELLNRMEASLGRARPVQIQVIREDPEGRMTEELTVTVPADQVPAAGSSLVPVPYQVFTSSRETLAAAWPFLGKEDTEVSLVRLSETVCFLLTGDGVRLWIEKSTFTPRRIEIVTANGIPIVIEYMEMVHVSEKVRYPARTEVREGERLLALERILPAPGETEGP